MQEQIINILADATGRDTADFSDASQNLFESGLLDSMATVSLLLGLQWEQFNCYLNSKTNLALMCQFQNLTVANGTLLKRLKNG